MLAAAVGAVAAGAGGPGRWLQRSVLRTDYPVLLASGSRGETRCASCARFAQTSRRESEVRSALRAPTPRLRCSAPQTAPRPASACRSNDVGGVQAEPPEGARSDWSAGRNERSARNHRGAGRNERHAVHTAALVATAGMRIAAIDIVGVAHTPNGVGKGAGRAPGARLCAAEERSSAGPRAQRASYF